MRVLERPVLSRITSFVTNRPSVQRATQTISEVSIRQIYHSARGYISGLLPLTEIETLRQELQQTKLELQKANARIIELEEENITDSLTGLLNARGFEAAKEREIELFKRHPDRENFSILAIDFDKLKEVNDTYRHKAGNVCLKGVGGAIKDTVRKVDFAARSGGDEFSVILPHASFEQAKVTAERIRKKVEDLEIQVSENLVLKRTVSIGVASSENVSIPEDIGDAADANAYLAKNSGRNRISARILTQEEIQAGKNRKS